MYTATGDSSGGYSDVSARRLVSGPSDTRPSASIERFSTSPLRKSLCVDTVQNVGAAARSVTVTARAASGHTRARPKRKRRGGMWLLRPINERRW